MTILGRSAIINSMIRGDLFISPILNDKQIGAASVDLRLGNVVLTVRGRRASHVDPRSSMVNEKGSDHDQEVERQQKHERFEVPFKTRFLLHPGSLALVPTLEWLKLPSDIFGTVTARSTWAREGLSIATATIIEPNYKGIVTLELANLGQIPIALYPGLPVAQIAFIKVDGKTVRIEKSQFDSSFEPRQGNIASKSDFVFLPSVDAGRTSQT